MGKNQNKSGLIDGILKVLIAGGTLSAGIVAPNILQVLDKPVNEYLKKLDKRAQDRELRKTLYYMKKQKLINYKSPDNYEHGILVTKAGLRRAEKVDIENLSINRPKVWDKKWRLVFYDIPEKHKTGRDALTTKMKSLKFKMLQKSVWVYPYECRKEIEIITSYFKINRYVTYVETQHIDHEQVLRRNFNI